MDLGEDFMTVPVFLWLGALQQKDQQHIGVIEPGADDLAAVVDRLLDSLNGPADGLVFKELYRLMLDLFVSSQIFRVLEPKVMRLSRDTSSLGYFVYPSAVPKGS